MPTPLEVFGKQLAPPTPDGKLIIHTIWGKTYEYPYAEMRDSGPGWRSTPHYMSISVPGGRKMWPWRSIASFDTIANSVEYDDAKREWRKRMGFDKPPAAENPDA